MSKSPALLTLLLASTCIAPVAHADETAPASPQGATEQKGEFAEQVQRITITGGRNNDMEQRRNSTASKMVFGREELDRDGDSTVGEILKRLPGVTISGRPGRGGDIRMRGLGNGYTQILLNGERPVLLADLAGGRGLGDRRADGLEKPDLVPKLPRPVTG